MDYFNTILEGWGTKLTHLKGQELNVVYPKEEKWT